MSIKTHNATSAHSDVPKKPVLKRAIGAALIGNTLEWFVLSIYAYFAVYIGKVFFPSQDPAMELIMAYGAFGISFLIRPVGAMVLGSS